MNHSIMLSAPEKVNNLLASNEDTNVVLVIGWKWFVFPVFVRAKFLPIKQEFPLLKQANQEISELKKVSSALEQDNVKTNAELSSLSFAFEQFQEKRKMLYRYEKDSTFLKSLISLVGSDLILAKIVNSYITDSHVLDSEKKDALATSDKKNQSECHNKPTTPNHNQ